jgi:hypothetical protein
MPKTTLEVVMEPAEVGMAIMEYLKTRGYGSIEDVESFGYEIKCDEEPPSFSGVKIKIKHQVGKPTQKETANEHVEG